MVRESWARGGTSGEREQDMAAALLSKEAQRVKWGQVVKVSLRISSTWMQTLAIEVMVIGRADASTAPPGRREGLRGAGSWGAAAH